MPTLSSADIPLSVSFRELHGNWPVTLYMLRVRLKQKTHQVWKEHSSESASVVGHFFAQALFWYCVWISDFLLLEKCPLKNSSLKYHKPFVMPQRALTPPLGSGQQPPKRRKTIMQGALFLSTSNHVEDKQSITLRKKLKLSILVGWFEQRAKYALFWTISSVELIALESENGNNTWHLKWRL